MAILRSKKGFFMVELLVAIVIFSLMAATIVHGLGKAYTIRAEAIRLLRMEQEALTLIDQFERGIKTIGYTEQTDLFKSAIESCSYSCTGNNADRDKLPYLIARITITDRTTGKKLPVVASRVL